MRATELNTRICRKQNNRKEQKIKELTRDQKYTDPDQIKALA